ncbi:MAG: MFS transporter [Alphaproteobacteria bacterium]|nr:MFS transporter [Alphaproteobacteria bacterium]
MPDGTTAGIPRVATEGVTLRHRLADGATMLMVSALALLLLVYVGYGAAHQRYTRYILSGATTQGEIIRSTLEASLRNGLALNHFVGFGTLARPIIDAENGIAGLKVVDRTGTALFVADDSKSIVAKSVLAARGRHASDAQGASDLVWGDRYIVVVMPLHDRFERVGHLIVSVPRADIDVRTRRAFEPLILCAVGLSLVFAVGAAVLSRAARRSWLPVGYAVIFVAMATLVTGTMIVLYSEGTAAKTNASTASLAQRLKDIPGFNLNFDQFDGIDEVLGEYKRLDPDIAGAALIVNGVVHAHTSPDRVGQAWAADARSFEYVIDISNSAASVNRIKVAVAVPRQVVIGEVAGSIRDFAALFIASGFFAGLFFRFAGIMSDRSAGSDLAPTDERVAGRALELARPLFFLAVFVEHLNYPFLPQHVLSTVGAVAGPGSLSASAPFAGYYLAFALALIPGSCACGRFGSKRLVSWGLLVAAAGLMALPLADGLATLTIARVVAGLGQGLLFIGIQSYIVSLGPASKRTQGAAIIVFGFQGGMISGTAIGSLLVGYVGPAGVFALSAGIALTVLVYSVILLPNDRPRRVPDPGARRGPAGFVGELAQVLRPGDFLGTMLLIGIPAKAVMTGVVLFGLPLLLAKRGYSSEAIGQLIMLYAIGVLVTSEWISRVVDRTGAVRRVLVWGAVLSGIGTMTVGATGDPEPAGAAFGELACVVAGFGLLGIAHGLVNAPIITSIGETAAARRFGVESVTAAYRFLERIGHVLGPIVVGQVFAGGGQTSASVAWIGLGLVALALTFVLCHGLGRRPSPGMAAR